MIFLSLFIFFMSISALAGAADPSADLLGNMGNTLQAFGSMDAASKSELLSSVGVSPSDFTAAKIFAWIIFGVIGMAVFMYGKKARHAKSTFIGIALMGYPYFVNNTIGLYLIGALLCIALYLFRE